jgi:glycosyltransferase involved in cell wall biosynthesis
MRIQRKIYIPRSLSLADKVIAISDFTKNDIISNYKFLPLHKIIRIYNYFNFEKFSVDIHSINRRINSKYFLCVSSLLKHKNIITIVKAFNLFCQTDNQTDLVLVGSLQKDSFLDEYIEKLDPKIKSRIHFLSQVSNPELSQLYQYCEAYISASLFEGLGMPVVEAMYFNIPLILSDIEVFREITNGNANFFNPTSVEDLCNIMNSFNKQNVKTRTYVISEFAEMKTSHQYINQINEMLKDV